jgi:Fe-S-cluster containining protein
MNLPIITYICEPNCGACCQYAIVEIDELDIAREPRLKEVCQPFKSDFESDYTDEQTGENLGPLVPKWENGGMLACGGNHPCKMLTPDKRCDIYPTRPNCCVAFRAGSELCQQSRESAGLPRLKPAS